MIPAGRRDSSTAQVWALSLARAWEPPAVLGSHRRGDGALLGGNGGPGPAQPAGPGASPAKPARLGASLAASGSWNTPCPWLLRAGEGPFPQQGRRCSWAGAHPVLGRFLTSVQVCHPQRFPRPTASGNPKCLSPSLSPATHASSLPSPEILLLFRSFSLDAISSPQVKKHPPPSLLSALRNPH